MTGLGGCDLRNAARRASASALLPAAWRCSRHTRAACATLSWSGAFLLFAVSYRGLLVTGGAREIPQRRWRAAVAWLQRYFDSKDRRVGLALAALKQLAAAEVTIDLPDISGSLEAVRNAKLVRERGLR